jgi:hypothetical protein
MVQLIFATGFSSLDDAAVRLASAFGLQFEPRDSLYWGEYFSGKSPYIDEAKLVRNDCDERLYRDLTDETQILILVSRSETLADHFVAIAKVHGFALLSKDSLR